MAKSGAPAGAHPEGPSGVEARARNPREIARIVGIVVALFLLVGFVIDNSQTVKVGFIFFSKEISLIWALLIAALLGAIVDRLVIFRRQRHKAEPEE